MLEPKEPLEFEEDSEVIPPQRRKANNITSRINKKGPFHDIISLFIENKESPNAYMRSPFNC